MSHAQTPGILDGPTGTHVLVGCYTGDLGHGVGLAGFRLAEPTGGAVEVSLNPPLGLDSPSYLIPTAAGDGVYAVTETEPSRVHRVLVSSEGPRVAESVTLSGAGACHLGLDETGRFLLVAHYGDGSASAVAVGSDGALGAETGHVRFAGAGPVLERQEAAHAHQVVSAGGLVYVPDLGSDQIHVLHLDPEGGLRTANDPIAFPAGSGPRHLAIDGNTMVIACELTSELWLARREQELWRLLGSVRSTSVEGDSFPSALRYADGLAYVANRGPNTFSVFRVADEGLSAVAEVQSTGDWPRDLVLDGDRLWIANQHSDQLAVFVPRSADRSRWGLDFQVPLPSPACIVVLP